MHEIAKKDKLIYFKFLNSLPKKINKLYFGKLEGKFRLNNKSKKKFDPVTNIDRTLEIFLRTEISKNFPDDGIIGEEFKIKKTKSTCLIVDYAKNENFGNSLKSIKKQKIINPLKEIGNSDISTHVNFNLIKETSTKQNLNSHGPVSQRKFLIELGILYRAEILIKNANNKQKKKLKKSLDFLINKKKMGEIFNVISISNKKINNLIGF